MSQAPIHLYSDRLDVEVSQPGIAYAGTRFDWTGFVTQVNLDGRHTFCVPEDYRPGQGTGGIGLCNEFGIDAPIGYEEAGVGETFPKLGIGLLGRLDERPYSFWYPHQILAHFPIQVAIQNDQATFTTQPLDCRGYAVRLVKTLRAEKNQLRIDYQLENVGSRPIHTNEYVHNFVGIDQRHFGPEYVLNFPYPTAIEEPSAENAILTCNGAHLIQKETPQEAFYARLTGFHQTAEPQWELVYQPAGTAMREYDEFTPTRIAVWGTQHVISVEVFHAIDLLPGQTQRWARRYEFLE